VDDPLYPNVRDSRDTTDNVIVPCFQRGPNPPTEPLYHFTCVACGENIGHGHLLTDCLKSLRRQISDLAIHIAELESR
jgi:hypothetical protein